MSSQRSGGETVPFVSPVIVVTGASQGIGEAIARAFAARGDCFLVLLARRGKELEEVAADCRSFAGVRAEIFVCDVTDPEQVAGVAAAVGRVAGAVDVLINNAGHFAAGSFLQYTLADFDQQIAVNLRSAFMVSQAFAGGMAERGTGDIVNICSVASLQAHPGGTGYCAAKAGLLGLTRVMREELRTRGVRVTAVLPGATSTPSWDGSGVPESRMMAAGDVARAVVDLTGLGRGTVVEEIVLRPAEGDL